MQTVNGQRSGQEDLRRLAGPLLRLLGGVGASAVATYVYLIVVARAVGPVEYGAFSAFWALVVILGAGVYLPIEQETGRRGVSSTTEPGGRSLWRAALPAALVVTAVLGLLLLVGWAALGELFADRWGLGLALVFAATGYAVQYPVRGLLSAERHYGWYATVLGTEGLARMVLVVLLVSVVEPDISVLATVVGLAALLSGLAGAWGARRSVPRTTASALALLRSVGVLIAGAAALQTLLYGGVLVARVLAPTGEEVLAGQLLAAITITRIPVFLFQSMESLVVPRIAQLAHRGDRAGLLAVVRRLVAVVAVLAVLTALGSALLGPWLVHLMFGAEYAVSHATMALLGGGTAVFMLAVAASDITVSLRGHRQMAVAWAVGLAAGALVLVPLSDLVLRVTLPLIVGSAVAAVLLVRSARARLSLSIHEAP